MPSPAQHLIQRYGITPGKATKYHPTLTLYAETAIGLGMTLAKITASTAPDFGITTNPIAGTFPDENYAREIMQLFSIGLQQVNNYGSVVLESNGFPIPTYTNLDIDEYAKIFTGFGDGSPFGEFGAIESEDEIARLTTPMKMYNEWHEPGQKNLLNGLVVPAGQT